MVIHELNFTWPIIQDYLNQIELEPNHHVFEFQNSWVLKPNLLDLKISDGSIPEYFDTTYVYDTDSSFKMFIVRAI